MANHVKYCQVEDEIIDAVASQFVHPYNKEDISLRLSDSYFKNLSHCKNIILLGDSLGDLLMSCGATANTVLTIGFLNEKVRALLNFDEWKWNENKFYLSLYIGWKVLGELYRTFWYSFSRWSDIWCTKFFD